ncbi:class I SAM-dependent methyltransferase [Amycolatopsis sp. lyj-346]|uniref:class I SAM-dependent methyltransferase n=1 Tax=Amycolatopsis sp. lyj-346 TaxID=2789289 RepID=UPI00397BE176
MRAPGPELQPLVERLSRRLPGVAVIAYDGSRSGPAEAATTMAIRTPAAFAKVLRAPRGLGLARAWVAGDIEISGDMAPVAARETELHDPAVAVTLLATALRVTARRGFRDLVTAGATASEYRAARPGRHTVGRDRAELDFHYGLTADFYRLLLGPSMTYSGAMFDGPGHSLEAAQECKHARIAGKLALGEHSTVLDIGCGWGSFLDHANTVHGSRGIGFTASRQQCEYASRRFSGRPGVRIRYGDYRRLLPLSGITAAAGVGMYEHVGERHSPAFFALVRRSLRPGARFLNQAITRREAGPRRLRANAFAQRYVFPNGQLLPLSRQLADLDRAGFRVLSTESFGEGYARTTGAWLGNLERNWDACVAAAGLERARAWRAYLAGSRRRFEDGTIDVTQVLAEAR